MAKALELLTSEHKGTKIVTKRNTVPVLNMAMMLDTDLHQDLWKQVGRKQFSVPWDETYDVLPLEEQQKRDVTVYHPGRYEQGIWMPARWEATDGTDLVGQIAKNLSEYNIQQALHRAKRIYL